MSFCNSLVSVFLLLWDVVFCMVRGLCIGCWLFMIVEIFDIYKLKVKWNVEECVCDCGFDEVLCDFENIVCVCVFFEWLYCGMGDVV